MWLLFLNWDKWGKIERMSALTIPAARRTLNNAPIIDAANGKTPTRTPVWFMRQAGRSLPEYKKVREGISMLDSCFMPELLAEITLQPVRRHDVDAAILFSDIVVPRCVQLRISRDCSSAVATVTASAGSPFA